MSKCKLILIEGIPGAGKSTTAENVKKKLGSRGMDSELFLESNCSNPSDLAWVSLLEESNFTKLLQEYPGYDKLLDVYSEKFEGYTLVYYQKMRSQAGVELPESMMEYLARFEPYDGRMPEEDFCRLIRKRYGSFAEDAGKTGQLYLFESSYFQNQINELLLFHNMDRSSILEHLKRLEREYERLNPLLVYLNVSDVRAVISKVADERRSPDREKYPDWIDGLIRYISNTRYGKENGLAGFDGVVRYFERRREIELDALEQTGMDRIILENYNYDPELILGRLK